MQHKIKTFEDACTALKLDSKTCLPDVSGMPEKYQKPVLADAKLTIIAEALNEGWTPDWDNGNWDKYYPWFDMRPSVGFSFLDYDDDGTYSTVGSRLCYKSSELAEYAGRQFLELYKDKMVIS